MYSLGIDLGASSLKTLLVDAEGRVVDRHSAAIVTHQPSDPSSSAPTYWAEQNPHDWWTALDLCLTTLADRVPDNMAQIEVIGITAGAHIAVLVDAENQPLRPAILWSDQRASHEAEHLRREGIDVSIAGNRAQPTWSLPQLMWIARHQPEIWRKTHRLYFAKDWLRQRLTGDFVTDPGEACGALLSDWHKGDWSDELLGFLGPHRPQLPHIAPANDMAGVLAPALAHKWGIQSNARVVVGSIDTSMEWYCCGPPHAGMTSLKLASAGVLSCFQENAAPKPPLSLYPDPQSGLTSGLSSGIKGSSPALAYYAAGMNQCMGADEWARQLFASQHDEPTLWNMIATSRNTDLNFYPYLAGERAPLWNAELTGTISGLTRASTAGDIMRAVIEGLSFAFRDIYESYGDLGLSPTGPIYLLGGGSRNDVWCQILADTLGCDLIRPPEIDAAYGVARFAWDAAIGAAARSNIALPPSTLPAGAHFKPQKGDVYAAKYMAWRARRQQFYPQLGAKP